MHETQTEVAADGSNHPAARPERLSAGALTLRTEHRTERRGDVLVIWLTGALDQATAALLDREIDVRAGHATHVVLDLTGLELIDPSGVETLVRTHLRACEKHQRTSFRQGRHAGRLPRELTYGTHLRFQPAARRADGSTNATFFAHATGCPDVDHQRPLVIDPETRIGVISLASEVAPANLPSR